MAQAPIIVSRQRLGGPQAIPQLSTGEGLLSAQLAGTRREAAAEIAGIESQSQAEIQGGRAIAQAAMGKNAAETKFAGAVSQAAQGIGNAIVEAQAQTRLTEAQSALLKRQEARREEFRNDQDWQTAPTRLSEAMRKDEDEILSGFGAADQAKLRQSVLRSSLSLQREVSQTSLTKMNNAAVASQTELSQTYLTRASRATSADERLAIIQENDTAIDGLVAKGILEPTQALTSKQNFRQQLDQTELYKGIKNNPEGTLKALQDPAMFGSLTPLQRETATAQAQAALDERKGLEAQDMQKRDPAAAAATYSRAPDQSIVGQVVRRALIPGESGGNAGAQSHAGAAGIAQIMPDTARGLAKRLGWSDLDGLDDAGVRAWLKANPEKSTVMAEREIGDIWRRTGSLAAAFAGYHAGQGAADAWHAKAVAAFGPGYTAAQFISVIPESSSDAKNGKPGMTTRDYVAGMLARAGADPGRGGVSTNAAYRIGSAVDTGIKADVTQQRQQINQLVSLTQDDRDAVLTAFKSGYATDPQVVAAAKAPLIAAASAGDATAVQKLRQFTEMEQAAPLVREAYQMNPASLETGIAVLRREIANGNAGPAAQRRLQVFEAVQSEVTKQAGENPVGLIERSGRQPVTTVPVQAPATAPEFGQALQQRAAVAVEAQHLYQGALKPLKPQEAAQLKQRYQDATAPERLDLVKAFHQAMPGPAFDAATTQIGADKLTVTAARLSAVDPELGPKIMRGAALLKSKGVDDGKAADLRTALGNTLGRSVFPPEVQGELVDAALAIYVADRDGKGALFDNSDPRALEGAIESVTGKLAKVNGVKVPLPRGVSETQFTRGLADLRAEDLGGTPVGRDGQPLDIGFLRSYGRLRPQGLGDGRYMVMLPGPGGQDAAVRGADGQPLVVDMLPAVRRAEQNWPQVQGNEAAQAYWDAQSGNAMRRADPTFQGSIPPARGPYATPAEEKARSLEITRQQLKDLEAERDGYANARAPAPDSILGRQVRARIERDLALTRQRLKDLGGEP
ncbi:MAG: transglycosylase SLT domain-containing protein [Bosea sp.]|uniref:transglycosylase SLT domain-containing protein n=1 Tax=unclassified Bosea (in: a-proteobacteria) TaxID=2653178 RepID=UPI00095F70FE|nr:MULTISPECIES: transglycosylase SLT domain-containing protein [unclassified Bosea (in: a-proteobacteria)]MBN9458464.1 transglycosylase SLT domain-containing protein [Bosea sp. (in: a-proteobacteria)]OJV06834.1 MAG: hypothetical protein BGO20_00265 [Bosea sp. 67-29]